VSSTLEASADSVQDTELSQKVDALKEGAPLASPGLLEGDLLHSLRSLPEISQLSLTSWASASETLEAGDATKEEALSPQRPLARPSMMLEISNALHLPLVLQKCPNSFVSYSWQLPGGDEDLGHTDVIYHSTCPAWDHRATLRLPLEDPAREKLSYPSAFATLALRLFLWHQDASRDCRRPSKMLLGTAVVSLAPLLAGFHELDGYFHISAEGHDAGDFCGQVRLKLRASLASFCEVRSSGSAERPKNEAHASEPGEPAIAPLGASGPSFAPPARPTVAQMVEREPPLVHMTEDLVVLRESSEASFADLNVLERHKELLAKWAIQLAEPAAPAALAAPALPAALAALAAPEADQPEDPKEPEVELPEAEPDTAEESEEEVLPEPQGFESAREVARQKIAELDELQRSLLCFGEAPEVRQPEAMEKCRIPSREDSPRLPDEPEPAAEESLGVPEVDVRDVAEQGEDMSIPSLLPTAEAAGWRWGATGQG